MAIPILVNESILGPLWLTEGGFASYDIFFQITEIAGEYL